MFGVVWVLPVLFDVSASAPDCAAPPPSGGPPGAAAASLLQRRHGRSEQAPLIEEVDEDMFEAATKEGYFHSCARFDELRQEHLVDFPIALGDLQAKAEEQMHVAQREVQRRQDVNSSLLMKLREMELHRWSQERVQMNLFNPTVVPLPSSWQQGPEERWLASFRHMEITPDVCIKHGLSNIIILVVLDAQLRPTRPAQVLTYQDVLPTDFQCQSDSREGFLFLGPEDPRLFHMPNDTERILMLYTARQPTNHLGLPCSHLAGRMYLAEITADLLAHGALGHFVIPFETEMNGGSPRIGSHPIGGWEKNWSPFVYTDDLGQQHVMLQEAIHPHIVLPMDENFMVRDMVYNTTSPVLEEWLRSHFPNKTARLHGGVAPLLFTEALPGVDLEAPFYLTILHTKTKNSKVPEAKDKYIFPAYLNYLFAFEAKPPFAIQRIGYRELPLSPSTSVFWCSVAFPTQMLRTTGGEADEHGEDLSILYGAGDLTSRVLNLPLHRLSDFF